MENTDASGFVLLSDVIPDAILDIRYYTTFNFTGERVDGYSILTVIRANKQFDPQHPDTFFEKV